MSIKQQENLRKLAQTSRPDQVMSSIKNEIDFFTHQLIGLGRRMPVPDSLNLQTARKYKQQLFDRVIEIYGRNPRFANQTEMLHMVATCAADDEFYAQTKLEPEQVEIYIADRENSASLVSEEKQRKPSYDYLQIMTRSQGEEQEVESDERSVNTDGAVEHQGSSEGDPFGTENQKKIA